MYKIKNKFNNKIKNKKIKKQRAFSLIEVMLTLIIASIIIAIFAPVITKKITEKSIDISSVSAAKSFLSTNCDGLFDGDCRLCNTKEGKEKCLMCKENCEEDELLDKDNCKCTKCNVEYGENCIECNINKCKLCESGYFLKMGSYEATECTVCDAGYYCEDGYEAKECPDGKYCPEGSVEPTDCPAGKYPDNMGIDCVDCPAHCTSCTSATNCTACEGDWEGTTCSEIPCSKRVENCAECDESQCISCDLGYYSYLGRRCILCNTGRYCPDGVDPYYCPSGTYNELEGATSVEQCLPCPDGYFCTNGMKRACNSVCKTCTYTGVFNCLTCANGYYPLSDVGSDGAMKCGECPAACGSCDEHGCVSISSANRVRTQANGSICTTLGIQIYPSGNRQVIERCSGTGLYDRYLYGSAPCGDNEDSQAMAMCAALGYPGSCGGSGGYYNTSGQTYSIDGTDGPYTCLYWKNCCRVN